MSNSNDEHSAEKQDGSVGFYRLRAELCQRMAAASADSSLRDQWLQLANQWTYLVLHANQKAIDGERRTRRFGSIRGGRDS